MSDQDVEKKETNEVVKTSRAVTQDLNPFLPTIDTNTSLERQLAYLAKTRPIEFTLAESPNIIDAIVGAEQRAVEDDAREQKRLARLERITGEYAQMHAVATMFMRDEATHVKGEEYKVKGLAIEKSGILTKQYKASWPTERAGLHCNSTLRFEKQKNDAALGSLQSTISAPEEADTPVYLGMQYGDNRLKQVSLSWLQANVEAIPTGSSLRTLLEEVDETVLRGAIDKKMTIAFAENGNIQRISFTGMQNIGSGKYFETTFEPDEKDWFRKIIEHSSDSVDKKTGRIKKTNIGYNQIYDIVLPGYSHDPRPTRREALSTDFVDNLIQNMLELRP